MRFIADLHIHSRFSMATASNLDLENLYLSAQDKGITLIATGDCTHPGWYAELESKLVPAEPGFYALHPEIRSRLDSQVPSSCRGEVRFILSSEISCIYKKDGRVRKNHNLVYFPDLFAVKKFNERLGRLGNIVSDGRPILGLDARNLLELVLDTHEQGFLIPAHIWTPWFSLLGSKSGFNHIHECFEDLTDHIFAVETGLSSDPAMNWRVSFLDNLALVSNSDAHSPGNLGREANLFNTDFHYMGLYEALKKKNPEHFLGTYEFYPEEGKYHLDGHRKCGVSFSPEESLHLNGLCPVCKKPLTLGVLYRVCELADKETGEISTEGLSDTENRIPFHSLVPLKEILSEILGTGVKTKKVSGVYEQLLNRLGPELFILQDAERDTLKASGIPLLDEAIFRVRENRIHLEGGYDGDYGKVFIFSEDEKRALFPQKSLFTLKSATPEMDTQKHVSPVTVKSMSVIRMIPSEKKSLLKPVDKNSESALFLGLNPEQWAAVSYMEGPSLIVAGPGTGKTRTLTAKMAWMLKEKKIRKEGILAITFTRKAAEEMGNRLSVFCGENIPEKIFTFHGLGYRILCEAGRPPVIPDAPLQKIILRTALTRSQSSLSIRTAQEVISRTKRSLASGASLPQEIARLLEHYEEALCHAGCMDFDDLVIRSIQCFQENPDFHRTFKEQIEAVFIDEYQDLDAAQYHLLRLLTEDTHLITAIGDPYQSIYGFRGGSPVFFETFTRDWPETRTFCLTRNYRSTENILQAAWELLLRDKKSKADPAFRVFSQIPGQAIVLKTCVSEKEEAEWIADCIQKKVGGTGHHAIYAGKDEDDGPRWGFSDIGVLIRTRRQARILEQVFLKKGIPFHSASEKSLQENPQAEALMAGFRICCGLARVSDLLFYPFGREFDENFVRKLWDENPWLSFHVEKYEALQFIREIQQKIGKILAQSGDARDCLKAMLAFWNPFEGEKPAVGVPENLIEDLFLPLAQGKSPEDFILSLQMDRSADFLDFKAEKVRILTLHASKGLEFPVLFMAGCEDGFLPYRGRTNFQSGEEAEERRLFYVGLTRAGSQLFLSWAQKRSLFGMYEVRSLSPFVEELRIMLEASVGKIPKKSKKEGQMCLF